MAAPSGFSGEEPGLCRGPMSNCSLSQPSSGGEDERDMVWLLIDRARAKTLRLEEEHRGSGTILGLLAAFQGTPTVVASS